MASLPRSRFASWPAFVGLALASHLARLLLAYVPSTWLWGLSAQRYLSPAIGWTTWSAALVCLLALWKAPLGAAAARERGAGALPRVRLAALLAAIAGALAWSLRDETYFIGDFIMRAGAVSRGSLAASFPQSMPGDVWVHQLLPAGLQAALGVPLGASARLLGALEAAALAALGVAAAGLFRARGLSRLAVPLIVAAQGTLLLCTGFGKGITEVSLLSLAFLLLSVRHLSRPFRWPALELPLLAAIWMHRSALALLPAYAFLVTLELRRTRPVRAWLAAGGGLRLALLALGCAPVAPRYVHVLGTFDVVHHFHLALGPGAIFAEAFAPLHLLDVANLCMAIAPAVMFAPLLLGNAAPRDRKELGLLLAGLAPWVAALLVVHPQQGVFRDLDVFAPFASVASLFVAWLASQDAGGGTRLAARGPALVSVSAAFATLQLLSVQHDAARGPQRALAFAVQAPERASAERAQVWSYLGDLDSQRGAYGAASDAYLNAARLVPTPRRRLQAAIAAARDRRYDHVRAICAALVRDDPRDLYGWIGYAGACSELGDTLAAARAAAELERLVRESPRRRALALTFLRAFPEIWPAARLAGPR